MRGDLLDVILVVVAGLFAWSGYRQGFVFGVLSFLGFVGGGLGGAQLAPRASDHVPAGDPALVGLTLVLLLALLGHFVGTLAGNSLRNRMTWNPARVLDSLGGGVVSVLSLLLIVWLIATAVASSPYPALASQVRRSAVVAGVDAAVPGPLRDALDGFRGIIEDRGFPDVFGSLAPTKAADTAAPDAALAQSPGVVAARSDVVKVTGLARSCSRRLEGSGFVYAADRVMTNAHVVAGVDDVTVEAAGRQLQAEVVLYNPERDIAVLRVPGLDDGMAALAFAAAPAPSGADAVVLGFPQDGPFRADPARVREIQNARGPDIYGSTTVVREVYALRAVVQPGNSGGPLIDPQGRVLGVVFAAAADSADTGYALTAAEVAPDAATGRTATRAVDTRSCD